MIDHPESREDSASRILAWPAILAALVILVIGFSVAGGGASGVYADGEGSPAACMDDADGVDGSIGGSADLVTHTVESDQVVIGVCIKSGENMFGDSHSEVLGNGTYEDGCFEVSGVGTQTVTVERIGEAGDECQGISHIDVAWALEQEEEEEAFGSLAVLKTCTDGEGEFTFNLYNPDDELIDSMTVGCGETATFPDLPIGAGYYVLEDETEGFNETGNTCSNETVTENQTAQCTITNTPDEEETGSLAVLKVCTDGEGEFTFTLYNSDDEVIDTMTVGCGETATFTDLPPGSGYYVLEGETDGFTETGNTCTSETVEADETAQCTITNTPDEEAVVPLPPAQIVVIEVPTIIVVAPTAQPPAAPVEQVAGVQQVITPPSTGDGGLRENGSGDGFIAPLLALAGASGLVTALSVRRFRHLKR